MGYVEMISLDCHDFPNFSTEMKLTLFIFELLGS